MMKGSKGKQKSGKKTKTRSLSQASIEDASKKKKLLVFAAVCLAVAHWLEDGTKVITPWEKYWPNHLLLPIRV
jgi:hypothetical protein